MSASGGARKYPTTDLQRIFIGNLPFKTNAAQLIEYLQIKQELSSGIADVQVIMDNSGRSRGYGFVRVPVTMEEKILEFNQKDFEGRRLKVEIARKGRHMAEDHYKFSDDGSGVYQSKPVKGGYVPAFLRDLRAQSWPAVIDIGANLTHRSLKNNVSEVSKKAKLFNIKNIIITGTSLRASREAQLLAASDKGFFYFTAGVHPHDAKHWKDDTAEELEKLAQDPACVAIGETGLDFDRNFSPPDVQEQVFEKQIQLACRLKKPLFLHERKAFDSLNKILDKYRDSLPRVVIHCFTGTVTEVRTYLDSGFYIGLTGFLCKDQSSDGVITCLKEKIIPLDKLMIETDSPFLFPDVKKFSKTPKGQEIYKDEVKVELDKIQTLMLTQFCSGRRNEPCSLSLLNCIIASCMNVPPEEVAKATTENATLFFGLTSIV
ncbi:3'-5' ssDNA/RNA exonuclease TatD-like [Ptychodera flava]|uniref:3'-5' ssDNA/RNA exonuclease TatD-like n=1 Tax=Ptychodera flava TaxID=63121 RepID=UPI00396A9BC6